jgi:hypothetical protein
MCVSANERAAFKRATQEFFQEAANRQVAAPYRSGLEFDDDKYRKPPRATIAR